MEESALVPITEGIVEQHDGWERPPTPEMMPIRYEKYDGWSGQEIEEHLREQNLEADPNTLREEQIEQLEKLMTGLDFWPQATEIFQAEQVRLAGEIDYTGRRKKHERRTLETILSDCHEAIRTRKSEE